eukprot:GHVS01086325.1.p1 GENE.GHVS01086325.1~~GHVS01086325.1.p1  ORF type:complete len:397 (+),score=82.27 GHVS01086325.1:81-1271(+)
MSGILPPYATDLTSSSPPAAYSVSSLHPAGLRSADIHKHDLKTTAGGGEQNRHVKRKGGEERGGGSSRDVSRERLPCKKINRQTRPVARTRREQTEVGSVSSVPAKAPMSFGKNRGRPPANKAPSTSTSVVATSSNVGVQRATSTGRGRTNSRRPTVPSKPPPPLRTVDTTPTTTTSSGGVRSRSRGKTDTTRPNGNAAIPVRRRAPLRRLASVRRRGNNTDAAVRRTDVSCGLEQKKRSPPPLPTSVVTHGEAEKIVETKAEANGAATVGTAQSCIMLEEVSSNTCSSRIDYKDDGLSEGMMCEEECTVGRLPSWRLQLPCEVPCVVYQANNTGSIVSVMQPTADQPNQLNSEANEETPEISVGEPSKSGGITSEDGDPSASNPRIPLAMAAVLL